VRPSASGKRNDRLTTGSTGSAHIHASEQLVHNLSGHPETSTAVFASAGQVLSKFSRCSGLSKSTLFNTRSLGRSATAKLLQNFVHLFVKLIMLRIGYVADVENQRSLLHFFQCCAKSGQQNPWADRE